MDLKFIYPFHPGIRLEDILFFDIETTGFSPLHTNLYLIGCVFYRDDKWQVYQWFSEHYEEEPVILYQFFTHLKQFKIIIHYNGFGFDIPYLEKKCRQYALPYSFDSLQGIDLYKEISSYKDILKVPNLKQKTIETFLGIKRDDVYTGGELISLYHEYVNSSDKNHLEKLLLHNFEDVIGMLAVTQILGYRDLFQDRYTIDGLSVSKTSSQNGLPRPEVIIDMKLEASLPKRIRYSYQGITFSAYGENARLRIRIHTDELKYFYPNYRDYYYLPLEDTSIHKSVAFYVDKNYRTKAKAATCYSKKTGTFLPQFEEVMTPYFKIDYSDKITFFELTDDFTNDSDAIRRYTSSILRSFLRTKK